MSVSSNSLLGTQATGNKSNTLLGVLPGDNGAGNQGGQSFSEVLKGTSISPTPAPAPPARVESKPGAAPTVAAPPKPVPASDSEQASAATGAETPSASAPAAGSNASKVAASKALSDAAAAKLANQAKPVAGGKAGTPSEDLEPTDAVNMKRSRSVKTLPVDAQETPVPGLIPVTSAADQQRPVAPAGAPEAGAAAMQSLASLLPSVAQAVFRQDSRAQPAGAGKLDAKSGVPTSTEERAKVLSAKAQEMAALTNADAPAVAPPPQDLSTLSPEVLRTLVGEKAQSGGTPGFSSVMQATQPAVGAFAAPLNPSVSQVPVPSTAVHLKSELQGPGFAPEMAARLTVLTGQGVQQAELHLNPADMGPVSVRIALDGQDAQVKFHAQHAHTREVLERSLPELAAALRDAGLTLSGGGVFQQPQDARPDGQAQRSNAPGPGRDFGPAVGAGDPAPVTLRRTQVGVLDMYA